ncbi:MAG TPA: SUMF1/EgtB/PvdO family nonheme iron enzyme [Sedimentisphaerales bacterium]|nr:SUMF1/EgtB/PvdO family nonheme iron enzyme [Sedimentisphaerales bacterium]HNU29473.1 SUMF1/EgtB/PvdO family nonheme iron enzyme [Sedimentisphaerales bacterium]
MPVGRLLLVALAVAALSQPIPAAQVVADSPQAMFEYQCGALRAAVEDLIATYGRRYPNGSDYLRRLEELEASATGLRSRQEQLGQLRRGALLSNPLLEFEKVLVVKRRSLSGETTGAELGLPSNDRCNSSLQREGYDNEIAVLSLARPDAELTTLYRPAGGGYVGEMDLHWDADRLLFTQSDAAKWKLWEIRVDGTGLRQVSRMPDDVDSFDACYLPSGQIVFGSTASYQAVPFGDGVNPVASLYVMDADGSGVRQLCFDQDHDLHPCVLANGQVLYSRWDRAGVNHLFLRLLMAMNPDGTAQRAVYGGNSWFPNALFFPRPLPGRSDKLVCILSGHHGVHRMGQLVLVDTSRGWFEGSGLVRRISGRGDPVEPRIADHLLDGDWPRFLHPYPLSDKHFLVACLLHAKANWGIYLADVFDNLVLVREEPGYALLEPMPIMKRARPPVPAERVNLERKDGIVYLHSVYSAPGLAGVPRGTIRSLRIVAYDFSHPGSAGPNLIGRGGPWDVMRIIGTIPLEEDGSATFRVPANTPVAVQAIDREGKAVQGMRSSFAVMPGETLSCVGCHETPAQVTPSQLAWAMYREPRDIDPWRGPARGFDFAREVQPVLNRHCARCHDGRVARPDLRPHPPSARDPGGAGKFEPAYEVLIPYVRRVGIEDDVSLLTPGEYHADTSELVQLLRKGHQGIRLDAEAWDRIVTWIDLNAPCHGTWREASPISLGVHARRMELRKAYGGPPDDPEAIPDCPRYDETPVEPAPLPTCEPVTAAGAPSFEWIERTVELAEGVTLKLVRIPAGEFVMGDAAGEPDERPPHRVRIERSFWMGECEITNAQFRAFQPDHDGRSYQKRHARPDDPGIPLNAPDQPVVRVSWEQATAFCRWLSERTRMRFSLPTEEQWEYACRAGTATPLSYGAVDADFSLWANSGDLSFADPSTGGFSATTGGIEHPVLEGADLSDRRFNDGFVATAPVGRFCPNPLGLYDMHGNVAEWTSSDYETYGTDGADAVRGDRKVVRGGSFFDRPERCRSAFRLAYAPWQRIFNVGFRVVCED